MRGFALSALSLKLPESGIWLTGTIRSSAWVVELLSKVSVTFGRPVAAPSGTFAVTVRLDAETGFTAIRPAWRELNCTFATCLRWWPLIWTLESVVALRTPPQVEMQTTSAALGDLGGVTPPPSASAVPTPAPSEATAITAATAVCIPRPRGGVPLGLISLFLWPAGLADGLAPKERRYRRVVRLAPGTASTPSLWFPRSAAAYRDGFGRLAKRRQYIRQPGAPTRALDVSPRRLIYHPPAAPAPDGGGFSRSSARPPARTASPEMKTYVATPENRQRDWFVVDAEGKTLGRLATRIADALRGKLKPEYTPHCDTGDFVIVVNAAKIRVTGNKLNDKLYHRHSGYPGGLRSRTLGEMLERQPEEVVRKAVRGCSRATVWRASSSPS